MGLVADIQPADIELRRSILESKLTRFAPLEVPGDVLEFLARTITRNVRELVGGLNKLIAYAQRSEEHTSELQSLMRISYAVFCLKTKTIYNITLLSK